MVKARMSVAEWEKIKSESNIVEKDGEAGRPREDEEVEPMAMPSKNPTKIRLATAHITNIKKGSSTAQIDIHRSNLSVDWTKIALFYARTSRSGASTATT